MKLLIGLAVLALITGAAVTVAPAAQACDSGNYYDPMHQVCAPYPPANCPPQYWQACAYPEQVAPVRIPLDVPDLSGTP